MHLVFTMLRTVQFHDVNKACMLSVECCYVQKYCILHDAMLFINDFVCCEPFWIFLSK